MIAIENKAWVVISSASGAVVAMLGGWDSQLVTLIILMAVDYVLGITIPLVTGKSKKSAAGKVETRISLRGFIKKITMLAMVLVAHRLDITLGTTWVSNVIVVGLICNEAISIVEHAQVAGVKVPKEFLKIIAAVRKKINGLEGVEVDENEIRVKKLLAIMAKIEEEKEKENSK